MTSVPAEQNGISSTTPADNKNREFELVLYFVFAFAVFVIVILVIPPVFYLKLGPAMNATAFMEKTTEIMQYQKDLLTVFVAAFSAWIGAGAAYFFGRENLRVTTDKMLAMRELPPIERLKKLSVQDILTDKNKVVDWTVTGSTPLTAVYEQLKSDPFRWFVPVVNEKGAITHVIDEEGIYRYVTLEPEKCLNDILQDKKISDLIETFEKPGVFTDDTRTKVLKSWIKANLQANVGSVEDAMTHNHVHLAIITDEADHPRYYITAGDIKRCLLV